MARSRLGLSGPPQRRSHANAFWFDGSAVISGRYQHGQRPDPLLARDHGAQRRRFPILHTLKGRVDYQAHVGKSGIDAFLAVLGLKVLY